MPSRAHKVLPLAISRPSDYWCRILYPDHSISEQHLGLVLRKVGICLLMILGVWFLHAAFTYRSRYPGNRYAFTVALAVTLLFDITLVYKLVATFYPDAQSQTAAYFILQVLMELIGLSVLSVDLQAYFLGGSTSAEKEEDIEMAHAYQVL
ncbi:unnamed protein product [Mortierella alpina]